MMVNRRHDYEATTIANRRYIFTVTIGGVSHDIDLNLINIFDNIPMIEYDVPCNFDVKNSKHY